MLDTYTAQAVKNSPEEATIVRKVAAALSKAGDPIVNVWDGGDDNPVDSTDSILQAVFAVDISRLYTKSGGWVLIVLGNEWDALADYTVSLEDALAPVNAYLLNK
jgi:hypothetical protein